MYILEQIETILEIEDKNSLNYKIALYIYSYPKKVLTMSLNELSKEIFVSSASITRFHQGLGYANYYFFKKMLIENLEKRNRRNEFYKHTIYKKLGKESFSRDLFKTELDEYLSNVTLELSDQMVTLLVNYMIKSQTIVFYGNPFEVSLFSQFISILRQNGKQIFNVSLLSTEKRIEYLKNMSEDDLIIIVSCNDNYRDFYEERQKENVNILFIIEKMKVNRFFIGQKSNFTSNPFHQIIFPFTLFKSFYNIGLIELVELLEILYLYLVK